MTQNAQIKLIQKQFLSCIPIRDINLKSFCTNFQTSDEKLLINLTVNHPTVLKYPISAEYQTSFLKKLCRELCAYCDCELIYEHLALILNNFQTENYKHYLVPDGSVISLEESVSFISQGTTGLTTWVASIVLAEWCLQNKQFLVGKRVLELGSGIGFLGILVAQQCSPQSVVVSDCHVSVLQKLSKNVTLNITGQVLKSFDFESEFIKNGETLLEISSACRVVVKKLEWCDSVSTGEPVDIIIAADVVYDSTIFEPLWITFKQFVSAVVILACTVRNQDTLDSFLKLAETYSFNVQELEPVQSEAFVYSQEVPVKLYAITSKQGIFLSALINYKTSKFTID